eukprot:4493750-Pyramimonas_sp.AAC.1
MRENSGGVARPRRKPTGNAAASGAGPSGPWAFALEDSHCDALDRAMAMELRQTTGGAASWTQEDGSTSCYYNKEVSKR